MTGKYITRPRRAVSASLSFIAGVIVAVAGGMLPSFAHAACTNCSTSSVGGDVVHTFNSGTGTFTAPYGVISVTVEAWGGGGGGSANSGNDAGGGGGGGAYASRTFSVTPGNSYSITVGAGGGSGQAGGNSQFIADAPADNVIAAGGGSTGNSWTGADGGQAADSVGAVVRSGGDGGNGATSGPPFNRGGGGGGGSATTAADGGDGNNGTTSGGGTGGSGQGNGGNGGNGESNGANGLPPGGGGGGAGGTNTNVVYSGGSGANGRVIVRYRAPPLVSYHMDEAGWNGTTGEVEDFSGNDIDATAINGANTSNASPAIPGPVGTCGYGVFNNGNQRVQAPNNSLINNAQSVSVAMWFRMDGNNQITPSNWQTLIAYGGVTWQPGGRFEVYRYDNDGRLYFEIRRTNGTFTSVSIPGTVFNNQWQHIVASFDRSTLQLRIWLNGTLAATATTTNLDMATVTGPLTVGSSENFPNQGINGNIDEVRVYGHALNQAEVTQIYESTRMCDVPLLDHIRILHSGSALTCTPAEPITIQACADPACDTLYTGTVSTTLLPSGWVGGDTIIFDGGSTTAALKILTPDTVTLGSTGTTPVAVNPTQCVGGPLGQPCDLEFHESGFIFDVPNLTACSTSADITISAVRMDETTQTCTDAFSNITKPVNFWSGYMNPGTGAAAVEVNGTPIAGDSPGTSFNLDFDANAEATITVAYPDAGQMQLHARHDGMGDDAGLVMMGSDSFISVPHSLVVYSTDDCPAGDVSCPVFGQAGEDFNLWVKAACDGAWVSDPGVDPQTIPATPNFRMSNVPLTHDLISPDPGNPGSLGIGSVGFGASENGVVLIAQNVSEVGVFTFTASPPETGDPVYSLANDAVVPGGTSRNIGRFTPYDFNVTLLNDPEFEPGCSNEFTYMDQAFDYAIAPQVTITARNAFGGTTLNYDDDWWMLDDFSEDESHAGAALPGAVSLDSAMAGHVPIDCSGGGCNGQFTTVFSGPFTYMRNGDPQDPFAGGVDIEFSIVDADGIAYAGNPFRIEDIGFAGGNDMQRWGRLRLVNASGSELLPLAAPVLAEYYDGGYRLNSEDSCTVLSLADDIRLSNPDTDGGNPQPGTAAITVGGGASSVTSGDVTLADGVGQLIFSAPGAGNVGFIDITTLLSGDLGYLLSDWSGDGLPQDNPVARVTFGIYEGPRSLIFSREPW